MKLIFGYLNYGNYGDEILAQIVSEHTNADTERLSSKNSILEHFTKLTKAKEIIAIGGLFQDLSGPWSVFYYTTVIILAWILAKPVYLVAQGIGPLSNPVSKFLTYLSFKLACQVSVRDQSSSDLLNLLKIKHYYGSDLAWTLVEELAPANSANAIIISLREPRENQFIIESIIAEIISEEENLTKPIIFLSMQEEDKKYHSQIISDLNLKNRISEVINASDYKPQELIKLIQDKASIIVSMRLHALILGHIAGLELKAITTARVSSKILNSSATHASRGCYLFEAASLRKTSFCRMPADLKLDELQKQINDFDLLELSARARECLRVIPANQVPH